MKKKVIDQTIKSEHLIAFLIAYNLIIVLMMVGLYWYKDNLWAFALSLLLAYPENEVIYV